MLSHIKEVVKISKKKGFAIGAFNVHGLESILGVANGLMRAKSPGIIQVSEGAIDYMGLKPVTHLVSTVAKNIAPNVPIALHLDHGKSLDHVFGCIEAGFSSVHIDASHLPLDENIALTKQVVEMAHRKNVWVQGEIGSIIGGHGDLGGVIKGIPIADPREVEEFVRRTKVDTIAAAIGTAHGVYDNEDVDIKLLKEIKKRTNNKVFVLHGGSGVNPKKIKKAIKEGVNIINIGSDIKIAFSKTLIANCAKNKKETDPRNLLRPTIKAVEDVVVQTTKLFGSYNSIKFKDIVT